MKRDPFYQQIVSGLGQMLDPDAFERCAADILRVEWPTLVPVRGGSDAGMDGAVADGSGTAFPLICTTGSDVIGNLTRSLASYILYGGTRKVAILATSQELTAKRRQNLEKRAQEEGFTLQQIYTQAAIADRLYRNPAWCRELLNLSGTPPALSVIPPTTRPLLDIPMIGRVEDLAWLSTQAGDRLLIGQPGCGKTFLLHEFAKHQNSLFVISRDRAEIAAELRTQAPRGLIVDDAHVDLALLTELQQLRRELGVSFDLIACAWPGQQDEVVQALGISASQVHQLDLLTRDQILAVIRSVGIYGPDELLRELVDQAEGRPGLAVTLAHLCRQGGVREVALGEALSRSIITTFVPLVGQHATELLGGFSVGGRKGMEMGTVAQLFGLSLLQVRQDMARLAAGGVVQQIAGDHLVVRPEGLRHTLVRDLFFQGALSLPIGPFMAETSDKVEAARTLIGARSRDGDIPDGLLQPLLEHLGASAPWGDYASLGRTETAYVLQHSDAKIEDIAGPALYYLPDDALDRLLEAALPRGAAPSTARALKRIQEWVTSAQPGQGEAVSRRRVVIQAAARLVAGSRRSNRDANDEANGGVPGAEETNGGEKYFQVACETIASALSPKFERTTMDPGQGNTVRLARGVLSLLEAKEMYGVWAEALGLLRQIPPSFWKPMVKSIEDWTYPARHGSMEIASDLHQAMQTLARQMIDDLAPLTSEHPGLMASLNRIARPLGIQLGSSADPDFTVLFPVEPRTNWREAEQVQMKAIRALADRWMLQAPQDIAERLSRFEMEADMAGLTWPRLTQSLCFELADRVPAPGQWAKAFAHTHLSGNFSRPFLERAVALQEEGWDVLLRQFLGDPAQRGAALLCVLMLPTPPPDLLDEALAFAGDFIQLVDHSSLRNEIPIATASRLLCHENVSVVAAVAAGLWSADPHGTIPEALRQEWRNAILRVKQDDYWLGEILKADPALTMDWLKARFADDHGHYFGSNDSVHNAVTILDEVQRISLLPLVPDRWGIDELIGWLVGGNPAVYAALLKVPHLRSHHLVPLGTASDAQLRSMTEQALSAGYDTSSVAAAFIPSHWSWSGSEAAMWQQWMDRFDQLSQQNEAEVNTNRLMEVAQSARAIFQQYRDQAQAREHTEAVFGRG